MPGTSARPVRRVGIPASAGVLLLLCLGAPGEARSLRAKLQPYCMSDYLRLCNASDTTRARIVSCFKRNVASVSARCKRAIETHTEFDPERIERRRK